MLFNYGKGCSNFFELCLWSSGRLEFVQLQRVYCIVFLGKQLRLHALYMSTYQDFNVIAYI